MANPSIELLSPARDIDIGKSAILAGADAVYIGASEFGARAAAGNSLDDISKLCAFARVYGAKVYLALNTLLRDSEIDRAVDMAWRAWEAGVDALIIQDMGLLECPLPPLELHASTQCHIASVDKAEFLAESGFERIVVARELSCSEIAKIHSRVPVRIEAFIHGALCVSYSGQCRLSYAIGGRSANRGECAQPCRMLYSFKDSMGCSIAPPAHYLSLRDMNRSEWIGALLDAGVSSFKIEGRLKDASYVKNVTLAYRRILDAEIAARGLGKESYGKVISGFEPDLSKTFNRGFTSYNICGNRGGNSAFSTPKARGEFLGVVSGVFKCGMIFKGGELSNGDGLLFEAPDSSVSGAQVSGVDNEKVRLGSPPKWFVPAKGSKIFRNKDASFGKLLTDDCRRKLDMAFNISEDANFYIFEAALLDARGIKSEIKIPKSDVEASVNRAEQESRFKNSFSKLGKTPFEAKSFAFECEKLPHLCASRMNSIRRDIVCALSENLSGLRRDASSRENFRKAKIFDAAKYPMERDEFANVLNSKAMEFYAKRGVNISGFACEANSVARMRGKKLMTTLHCILREIGLCKREGKLPAKFTEPFFLESSAARLRLDFDCRRCGMEIYLDGDSGNFDKCGR